MRKFPLLMMLFAGLLLAACKPARPAAFTTLTVTIKPAGISLSSQRLIAGGAIVLTLTNTTQQDHHLVILSREPQKNHLVDERDILYQIKLAPGETLTDVFRAPQAPGEYSVRCSESDHAEKGESTKIVVVHADYAR